MPRTRIFILLLLIVHTCTAQQRELNSNWQCMRVSDVGLTGEQISNADTPLKNWLPATVPGTVLTTLLNNKLVPNPSFGMNDELIPDIYNTGRDYYTYWFVTDFKEKAPTAKERIYLDLRGVNYSFDAYLNGHKLNDKPEAGMFCRSSFDISPYIAPGVNNRLAIIVHPPDPVGKPNGGQGGDGMIAHNITTQYTAGWDWIQPVHDRNTGIWDKVFIRRTGVAHIENTHVVTLVPGRRTNAGRQQAAYIDVTTEAENTSDTETISGIVEYELGGKKVSTAIKLAPHTMEEIALPELHLDDPKLWWPNGYGAPFLYPLKIKFIVNKVVVDTEQINVGIRQIKTVWNSKTNSREIRVNGQKIFIKGGNWILTDAMLRCSKERYDNEVRMHRDMNLDLIRVWGGGITERPEFYDACDKYGLLVMQDFWVSGDCNGRWDDPLKAEDTNARRKYPDDHNLFIASLEDQIRMLRNHPSLALWCGGNEIRPPADVLSVLKDTLLPELDNTRYLFEFSNDDSMSLYGGDGPYVLQDDHYFWQHRSFPFNSEIGSVGIGDKESLERIMPAANMKVPYYSQEQKKWIVDSVWHYHKYEGYDSEIEAYGHAAGIDDFTRKAQLVNYNQYRSLMEGASAHIWDWYTGIIIWKTQNPWTALKGQMYDFYLDPNACLYATQEGAKPVHVMYDPIHKTVMAVNNLFKPTDKSELLVKAYSMNGDEIPLSSKYIQIPASKNGTYYSLGKTLDSLASASGVFLYLSLTDSASNTLIDENLYWLPDNKKLYSGMKQMRKAHITVTAHSVNGEKIEVTISNPQGEPVAFFNRVALIDSATGQRILPAFYSDNYISVLPGQERTISIDYPAAKSIVPVVSVEGINVTKSCFPITP